MANRTLDKALGRRPVKILHVFFEIFRKIKMMKVIQGYVYLSVAN